MDTRLQTLLALMRVTLVDPAEGARRVLAMDIPRAALWQGFALVAVMAVLLLEASAALSPVSYPMIEALRASPLRVALLQAFLLFVLIHAVYRIGALFGGTGSFDESLRLVVWLEIVLMTVQMVQTVISVVLPLLGSLIGMAALLWFLWALTTMVTVLHGFSSRGLVFMGITLSFFLIIFALSIAMVMLGIVPPETM